jgi:hypothetical protein
MAFLKSSKAMGSPISAILTSPVGLADTTIFPIPPSVLKDWDAGKPGLATLLAPPHGAYKGRLITGSHAFAPSSPCQEEGWGEGASRRHLTPLNRTHSPSGERGTKEAAPSCHARKPAPVSRQGGGESSLVRRRHRLRSRIHLRQERISPLHSPGENALDSAGLVIAGVDAWGIASVFNHLDSL